MDSQIVAAVITGIFGLLSGIIISKADSIQLGFFDKGRKLKSNWYGFIQRVPIDNEDKSPTNKNKCTMQLRQSGQRVRGEVQTEITNSKGEVNTFRYSIKNGVLKDDYFSCDLVAQDDSVQRMRKHLFYIHTSGETMRGVFIGNRASGKRIILGSCELRSRP